jgi:hypothetical protein
VRKLLILTPLLCVIAGCGSPSSSKPMVHTYHDPTYHFSFQYRAPWTIQGKHGVDQTIGGTPSYVLTLQTPNRQVGVDVTVDHDPIPFPTFPEGKVAHDPSGGPDLFEYHHAKVSSWPAMRILRYSGKQVDGYFTVVNTHSQSYQIRMITGNPPFKASQITAYMAMVRSFKIPFS